MAGSQRGLRKRGPGSYETGDGRWRLERTGTQAWVLIEVSEGDERLIEGTWKTLTEAKRVLALLLRDRERSTHNA